MRTAAELSNALAHTAVDGQAVLVSSCTAGRSQAVEVGDVSRMAGGGQAVLVSSCTAGRSQAVEGCVRKVAGASKAGAQAVMVSSEAICTAAYSEAGSPAHAHEPIALVLQAVDPGGHTAAFGANLGRGVGREKSNVMDNLAAIIEDGQSLSSASLSDSCESLSALS